MRPEDLIKPISADAPCGDDLLAADDPDFVDYYFNVEDRLPTSYFNLARGTLFDPKSVDLKGEVAQIEPLLKRSRDLRLLGIEAKFQILSGRFKGFADAVMGMAALMEAYPDAVHPVDPLDRRNAIEELNAVATVVAPLEYAPLINDKRIGDVLFRNYGTGAGKIAPREGEEPGDSAGVSGALGSSENAKAVETLYAQLTGMQDALKTMTAVCLSGPQPATPQFDRLAAKLADMVDMVRSARPDLTASADAPEVAVVSDEAAPVAAGQPAKPGAQSFTVAATPAEVPDHRAAFKVLQAVEKYFVASEPASLALLLVVQARLLVGRPLVEALDALMENSAGYASITFGTDTGFTIPMARMRDLSFQANIPTTEAWSQEEEASAYDAAPAEWQEPVPETEGAEGDVAPAPEAPPAAPQPLEVVSRDHAGALLKQVEEFYHIREPASPIPILLFKARNMLSKDFHALVREILPPA